jgi:hypothetical protein
MDNIKRYVVTRDGVEFSSDASIMVWVEGADPKLNKESLWESTDSKSYVDELYAEEFKKEYNLNPPGIGAKRVMIVTYAWEEK